MSVEYGTQKSYAQNYTYPEFVIDERSGQVAVNLIDQASGKIVRHIASSELNRLFQNTPAQVSETIVS